MNDFRFILFLTVFFVSYSSEARPHASKLRKEAESAAEIALVSPPLADEVCFAPENPCDTKLVKFIQSATASIDIAIFDINLDQVVHEILVKDKKIPVRILVDKRQAKGENSLVPLLLKAGAKVRLGHQRGIMHNKFTIIDGKRLELGSFNYTNGAAFKNNENQLYLDNPKIVNEYVKRFQKIWLEGDVAKLPKKEI